MTTIDDQNCTPAKRPRGRPRVLVRAIPKTTAIGFRVPLQLDAKLNFVCELDSVGRSEFARRALETAITQRLKDVE